METSNIVRLFALVTDAFDEKNDYVNELISKIDCNN